MNWGEKFAKVRLSGLKAEGYVLVVAGTTATLIMFFNAVLRYGINYTWVWAEEVVRILFVWTMFLAITMSFIRGEHIGFGNLMEKNKIGRTIRDILNAGCLITVGGLVAWYGWIYNGFVGEVKLAGTDLPTMVFVIPGILAGISWVGIGIYMAIRIVIRSISREA